VIKVSQLALVQDNFILCNLREQKHTQQLCNENPRTLLWRRLHSQHAVRHKHHQANSSRWFAYLSSQGVSLSFVRTAVMTIEASPYWMACYVNGWNTGKAKIFKSGPDFTRLQNQTQSAITQAIAHTISCH
jgi:hypothetical protein